MSDFMTNELHKDEERRKRIKTYKDSIQSLRDKNSGSPDDLAWALAMYVEAVRTGKEVIKH